MLYDRDYNILTKDEQAQREKAERFKSNNLGRIGEVSPDVNIKYHAIKPGAVYHYESLFPNNFLFSESLDNKSKLKKIGSEFVNLLEGDITERDILNFINKNKYYNLIASLFHSGYTFGHHDAYLFKEFELPSTYKADYLLIGKNSHGYHFLFVELENPSGLITISDGSFGETIRKGIKQVRDWDRWIEGNFHSLGLVFDKYKNERIELPKEFRKLDKTRINFVVIAGRREDFKEKTYNEKRKLFRSEGIQVLHYDNLVDSFNLFQTTSNY
ncbi:MAG: Shedu anti-phage system protein SduA domain-containing protein [bacterium]